MKISTFSEKSDNLLKTGWMKEGEHIRYSPNTIKKVLLLIRMLRGKYITPYFSPTNLNSTTTLSISHTLIHIPSLICAGTSKKLKIIRKEKCIL